ncbi:cytochrome P450 [Fomitopsis serialis]|uniref:cytochrome P450 n=1 Tax=Fomitopsis serialis TaxID=139415 RepID=UPI002008DED1|nr:cytochrome P450 [Neoantrodia serialis]KAH9920284.1 cytochrome P450 [Neoantrodia serialis]
MFTLFDFCASLAALLASVALLAYSYPNRCIGTVDRPDLPGPRGLPLIGNLLLVFQNRNGMLKFLDNMEATYGPLFTFTLPSLGRNIVINRPEWLEHMRKGDTTIYAKGKVVRDVFSQFAGTTTPISTDGSAWKDARRLVQPIFAAKAVNTHASKAMCEIVPTVRTLLRAACRQNVAVDWKDLSGRLALGIFCKMAFDVSTDMLTTELSCLKLTNVLSDTLTTLGVITADRLFNPAWRITERFDGTRSRFDAAKARLSAIVDDLIRDRSHPGGFDAEESTDYLTALLASTAEQDLSSTRDTLMTLFFAGRDSTQNVILWALYELTRSPGWISLMREEVASRPPKGAEGIITFGELQAPHVQNYPIHLAVFFETLRLWPGLPKNARLATEDDVLPAIPEKGLPAVRVNKGDFLLWSDMAMMRNEDVWGPDAKEFNPRRHLGEDGRFVKPDTPRFHSFGSGPRACPAMQLMTYEFTAIFAGLLCDFDFIPVHPGVRKSIDALAPFMDGPFMVEVHDKVVQ